MNPDPPRPGPPDDPQGHGHPPGPDGVNGMDTGRFPPELIRVSKLLGIVGDPARLRVLLSLHSAAKTIIDLVDDLHPLTLDDVSREIQHLFARGLVETSGGVHNLTDLGRQLAMVALSLEVDGPE